MRCLILLLLLPLLAQAEYFVSIKSNEANLRVGPGRNYPIDWIYNARHLPLKVIDKYEQWRKVQDIDDTVGWMHQSLLSHKRYLIVTKNTQIYSNRSENSKVLSTIDERVIVKLKECKEEWCGIEVQKIKGFIHKDNLWGLE